jgi:hypothetical protein
LSIEITGFPTAVAVAKTSLGNGDIDHLLTVRNNLIFKDKINLRATKLKQLSVAYKGTVPAEVFLYLDDTSFNGIHVYDFVGNDSNTSCSKVSGEFISPQAPIAAFSVADGASLVIDLQSLDIVLPPQTSLSIGILSTGAIQNAICGLTFSEF